ncbi:hypothetical protein MANES_04G135500v8 [Manihot esculenta]|uniref:Uncharacterized protein n=1 Tax=Manihot esculenta TaxID=3983 RepID=A0ACB7HWT9_MANES|nr:hypothetical protein MANES_04G135500v8 [Manihot esculenta]
MKVNSIILEYFSHHKCNTKLPAKGSQQNPRLFLCNFLAQPCEGDLQGLITQCGVYVQKGGPRMDPSQGCCNVIKSIDIPCVCKYISRVIEEVIDMDKVVHVADFCGKPLTHGMKCGSYIVPRAG